MPVDFAGHMTPPRPKQKHPPKPPRNPFLARPTFVSLLSNTTRRPRR